MRNNEKIYQFLRYALVGISGVIVNLLFLYIFTEFFHVYYVLSEVFAFTIATLNNFLINKVWTFKENVRDKLFSKGTKFFMISGISLIVNTFFLYFFTDVLGIYYIYSQILASCFTLITNFTGNKFWTFKKI